MEKIDLAKTEDDWFEYKLEHDPRFQKRVAKARASLRAGKGIPWKEIEAGEDRRTNSSKSRFRTLTSERVYAAALILPRRTRVVGVGNGCNR